jgi:hypothetical protein
LVSEQQYERLRVHAGTAPRAETFRKLTDPVFVDLCIFLHDFNEEDTYMRDLLAVTEHLSARLLAEPDVRRHVRGISCLTTLAVDDHIEATKRFAFRSAPHWPAPVEHQAEAQDSAVPPPGTLLLAPADAEDRAGDVLCVFDADSSEPGAVFALMLNQPTTSPAQPLAFSIFDCGEDVLWWGGPTTEPFALATLSDGGTDADRHLPHSDEPRIFVTPRTALFIPGRDHPPDRPPEAVRIFHGAIWLSAEQVQLYRDEGQLLTATDEVIFDQSPETLAQRLRAEPSAAAS